MLATLALPLALIVALPDWWYSSPDLIDAWVYNGFFRNLAAYRESMFPGTYYGSRLGWLVPGHVAYSVLPPIAANAALHLLLYGAALVSLFRIVGTLAGRFNAAFTTILMGLYLPAARAFGSDYVDGAVVGYAFLSTERAIAAWTTGSRWAAVGAGAAAAAMIHSNVGAAFMLPFVLVWFVPRRLDRLHVRRLCRLAAWWCGGAAVCTLVLGAASVARGGRWLFFMDSLLWLNSYYGISTWDVNGFAWLPRSPWLFLPGAVLVAMAVTLISPASRPRLSEMQWKAIAALVGTVAVFAAYDFIGPGALLYWWFYASWLMPATFIVIGGVLLGPAPGSRYRIVIFAVVTLLLMASLRVPAAWLDAGLVPAAAVACIASMFVGAVAGQRVRLACTVVAVLIVNLATATSAFLGPRVDRRVAFAAIDAGLQVMSKYVDRRAPRLAVASGTRFNLIFTGLASAYLWDYSTVTRTFPTVPPDRIAMVEDGSLVVIVSPHAQDSGRFEAAFGRHGIGGRVLATHRVDTPIGPYYLTFVRAAVHSAAKVAS